MHGKNVALILDRTTGLVSPQFHVLFDNDFQIVRDEQYESLWQLKAGFVTQREIEAANKKKDHDAMPTRSHVK